MDEMLLTVSETAKVLKVNQNYVYDLIKKGFLPCLKLGRIKIRRVAIEQFLEKYEGKDFTDMDNVKDFELEAV